MIKTRLFDRAVVIIMIINCGSYRLKRTSQVTKSHTSNFTVNRPYRLSHFTQLASFSRWIFTCMVKNMSLWLTKFKLSNKQILSKKSEALYASLTKWKKQTWKRGDWVNENKGTVTGLYYSLLLLRGWWCGRWGIRRRVTIWALSTIWTLVCLIWRSSAIIRYINRSRGCHLWNKNKDCIICFAVHWKKNCIQHSSFNGGKKWKT